MLRGEGIMMGIPGNRLPVIRHKAVEPKPNSFKVLGIASSFESENLSVSHIHAIY